MSVPLGEGSKAAMEELETTPIRGPDYIPPAGLGLGYIRLEGQKDQADRVCRQCGRSLGAEVWAKAVSDGRGGIDWTAPICYRCMAGEGERRATEAERASRLAALKAKLAELRPKRQAGGESVAKPGPRLRRRRPAARAVEPVEEHDGG